jgi:uncharacterized protein involved in outer membrane biogenesis
MIDKAKLRAALKSPKTRRCCLRILAAVVLFGVLGFLVLPPIAKSLLQDQLGKALHRPVAISRIGINPYAMTLNVEGFSVQEREGGEDFVSFDNLYVNLQSVSVFRGGPVVGEVRLVNPRVRVVRTAADRYNFSDLVDEYLARPKPETDEPIPAFSVNNIQINGGEIEFDDRQLAEKHVASEINLTVPFISSMAYATETFVEPAFSATLDGAPLAIKGKSKPFAESLESEVILDLADLQLARFIDYSPVKLPIKMLSGALDSDLRLVFRQEKERPSTLSLSGTVQVKDLAVNEQSGTPLLSFKRFEIAVDSADLLGGNYRVGRVALDSPEVHVRASRQGSINWIDLLGKTPDAGQPAATEEGKAAEKAIVWSLGEAEIAGGTVHWTDESNEPAVNARIDKFSLMLKQLSSTGEKPAEFDASWRVDAGDLLQIEEFAVKGGQFDLQKREASLADVVLKGARVLARRTKDGDIAWLKPPALPAAEKEDESTQPWTINVAKYHGEDIGLRFEDAFVSPNASHTVEGLVLDAENISTVPGTTTTVTASLKFNRKGEIDVSGSVSPFPFKADLKLDVKALELLPLQPYFGERLNIAVTRGQLAVSGDLKLQRSEAAPAEASVFSGGFAGQATIGDFYAVDKLNSADFLRWKSFYFGKIDLKLQPDSVSIGEIALSDFFARVIVSPEGKLNLMQIVRTEETGEVAVVPSATEAEAGRKDASADGKAEAPVAVDAAKDAQGRVGMPIKIGKITLQGGTVRFTDNFVKPNYTANLQEVGGHLTGLSSEAGSVATLELRGNYDKVAPLNLSARINPLSAKPYLDLKADIKGIELTSLSAYSGKYAGYAIDKGKLSLFVNYKIENDLLEAQNRVFLDQLTFGDRVDSPDATSLPVTLAVSLLKNRNGEIDLNLPISGSLNDPQFSIGGLVVKVIVNLLAKAVTAPFALLGSMFGGGEELSNVEFDYGRATIGLDAQQRLENLAKALVDRPGLRLEVEGRVDPERDREGLKSASMEDKVRTQKREEMIKKGVESGPADTVAVSPEEYPEMLERAYKAEKFPKPRNVIGLVKSIPVEEMEKLMLANTRIGDDDLLELGERRARAVRDWLVAHEVPAERVFLLPSKAGDTGATDADEPVKNSRVDFSLK